MKYYIDKKNSKQVDLYGRIKRSAQCSDISDYFEYQNQRIQRIIANSTT